MNYLFNRYATMKIGDVTVMTEHDFQRLADDNIISYCKMRNVEIYDKYKKLKQRMRQTDAIDEINKEYPYVQPDTIRRIVYATSRQLNRQRRVSLKAGRKVNDKSRN